MEIRGIDHVQLYVANLDQATDQFVARFGLALCGRASEPAVGRSVALRCGAASLVLTAPSAGTDDVASYVRHHGYGVAAIGVRVDDAAAAFERAVAAGAIAVAAPHALTAGDEQATSAAVQAFGDVRLVLVDRSDAAARLPFGFEPVDEAPAAASALTGIDHLAVCLPATGLLPTATYYTEALGFVRSFEERVAVDGQAMDSIVVQDPGGSLVLTLLAQDPALAPGQVARFVDAHRGPGVQHIAFRTDDIVASVERMRGEAVDFLPIPAAYYDKLEADAPGEAELAEVDRLRRAHVLRDRDAWGTILQAFTRSTHPRGTLFYELVERRGARTFGAGNIRALYEAVRRVGPAETAARPG